jgi:hypothetical protein
MNRVFLIVVIVVVVVGAILFSRNAATPQPAAPDAAKLTVSPLTFSGAVEAPSSDLPLRVSALLEGNAIADAPVRDGRYSLTLPGAVAAPTGGLNQLSLLHGEGRLQGAGQGSEVQLIVYQDQNRNGAYDLGEPKLEPALLKSGSDPNLRAYLRYKVILLNEPATLKGSEDSPTGAKNYYRYNLSAARGYNIVQGDFASNGYEMSLVSGSNWDLLIPLPPGGKGEPPAFTP